MASDKLWLIRTSKKQILGPVSREKVIELIEKGALSDKDEVTKGNGYWFHLRERDLLDKYLYGDVPQEFNPISEAPDILTSNVVKESTGTIDKIPGLAKTKPAPIAVDDETLIPSKDDLEYPDMGGGGSDSEEQVLTPEGDDLDYPDMDISRPDITLVAPMPSAPASAPVVDESTVIMGADGEEVHIPSNDDLEYPDMDMGDDLPPASHAVAPEDGPKDEEETLVMEVAPEAPPEPESTSASVVSLNRKAPQSVVAKAIARSKPIQAEESEEDESDFEDEELDEEEVDVEEDTDPARSTGGFKGKPKREVRIKRTYEAPARNDRYLLVLLALVILILASGIVYYYSRILGKPLPFLSGLLIPSVQAQTSLTQPQGQVETTNLSKKKTSLIKTH